MKLDLNGTETAEQLIKKLVGLRIQARRLLKRLDNVHAAHSNWTRLQAEFPTETGADSVQSLASELVELRFLEIEIGRFLVPLCSALDRNASPAQIFEALNTNPADRDHDLVRKYGQKSHHLICVLDLENSASKRTEDWTEPLLQPLKWCHTMAFIHEMTTNAKFDRAIHDGANEFFKGAFGEYRERPLMERLAGRAV